MGSLKTIAAARWRCTSYDSQGRALAVSWPAIGTAPARSVTYGYAVGGNPLVNSVTDPTGTNTTTADLDGRIVAYTDASGQTTTTTYDQSGRVSRNSSSVNGVITTVYDPNSGSR